MTEWRKRCLGEITSFMSKGIPPKYVERENENTVCVLNQKCNRNFEIKYEESRLHDCSKKKVPADKMLQPGDVLINSTGTGTAGRVAQLYDVPTPTTIDGHMILLRPTEEIDSVYYGYAVKAFQPKIETLAEGSTGQTEINRKRLQEEIVISFPKETVTLIDNILYDCGKILNFAAPKLSKAYSYAEKKGIAVTTTNKIKFASSHIYLLAGDTDTIPLLNCINTVTYKSKKKSVVSVTKSGKIRAKKKGTTIIQASAGGKKYQYKVTVYGKAVGKRVNQIIKSVIKKDMTNYQKVQAVHNWMIRNVKYDYYSLKRGYVPSVSHTAKGALLKKVAVCDGYSHAFQMVMRKLKIPCRFVTGSSGSVGHAWNMVKLSGKWYHIDVTFDDPIINGTNTNKKPYYTYFLKSSSVMKKTHHFTASKYPKCNSKKYD